MNVYIHICVHRLVVFDRHYNKKREPGCHSIMQLKNMISQLFQSQNSGAGDLSSKASTLGGKHWRTSINESWGE